MSDTDPVKITVKNLKPVVKSWPPRGGERLANYVLKKVDLENEEVVIDLKGCPPAMLISSFFGGFRFVVEGMEGLTLDNVKWEADHDFQLENIRKFTEPHDLFKNPKK